MNYPPVKTYDLPKTFEYQYLIKFLVLGDSGVGKSSFLSQYVNGTFSPRFVSTVGIDFVDKRLVFQSNGKPYRLHLQIWDTAGQERFRSLTTAFYRDAMGFILMFDLTNERSFLEIRNWMEQLRVHSYTDEPDVILCGNKSDLDASRAVAEWRIREFVTKNGFNYMETSAATGENVEATIQLLLSLVVKKMELTVQKMHEEKRERIKCEREAKKKFCFC